MSKKRRPNKIMSLISTIIAVGVVAICAFPVMKLKEGSFLHAVLSPLHGIFDNYFNIFASEGLRPYGLIPIAALSVLNMVLAFMGAGLLQYIFRCTAFYSLYLLGTFFQRKNPIFVVVMKLPETYPLIAIGGLLISILMLLLIQRIKNGPGEKKPKAEKEDKPIKQRKEKREKKQKDNQRKQEHEQVEQPEQEEGFSIPAIVHIEEDSEEPKKVYDHDPAKSKAALSSLTDVEIPTFESFPNYLGSASVSSVDRGVYSVAEREAQIRREEQEKREAEERRRQAEEERLKRIAEEEERARLEAEENRKRLQNMFKPRNLMKRLHEDAQAEKVFPTYGSKLPDVDFGISENTPEQPTQVRNDEEKPVQFQSPYEAPKPRIAPGNDIPVSQRHNPFASRGGAVAFTAPQPTMVETPKTVIEPEPEVQSTSVFKEAAAQAELDEQLVMRKRQAEFEKRHLEEMQELERQRREAEEAARKAEEELAAAKAEMQRQQEEAKAEAARLEAEKEAAIKAEAARLEAEKAEEEEGISDADMAENDAKSRKGPDIDMVSGVAGLKSAAGGNPYLIDKQKFVYNFPPEDILKHYPISATVYEDPENDPNGQIIVETLAQFRIGTSLIGVQHGPTFTLYELSLAPGIKVTAVLNLAENLAMQLSVEDVRILAPIPGKVAIGVEVPNKKRDVIGFDVMMPALKGKFYKIPMVLGKTITGDSIVIDLAKTPHLLVAGTTGSGKSVCINGLICSVLYTKTPKEVRMILVDPKMVELSLYNGIPHLLTPVITDAKKALKAMNFVVEEMERRMALFSSVGAKKIEEYNEKITNKGLLRVKLPYIMVIIDEFADLMLAVGKELETSIKRITAVARFCGIHLVLATQRPSADVITGVIKSNIPTQIAFAVSNSMNSRIIIDQVGAEKLLGRGDMLYNNPEARQPSRIQGAYIDSEIEEIVDFVKTQGEPDYIDESYFEDDDDEEEEDVESAQTDAAEDKFMRAWKIVSDRGEASGSFLQRKMGIGYNTAANLIEQLEEAGYVGPARGSKPREILKYYGTE